jgi:hypothetical protein
MDQALCVTIGVAMACAGCVVARTADALLDNGRWPQGGRRGNNTLGIK